MLAADVTERPAAPVERLSIDEYNDEHFRAKHLLQDGR